jgi:hypothetical protein
MTTRAYARPLMPWLQSRGNCESLNELQAIASASGIQVKPILIESRPAFFKVSLPNGQTHDLSSIHAARGLVTREIERQTLNQTPKVSP